MQLVITCKRALSRAVGSGKLSKLLLLAILLPLSASAYLMTETGPEAIILQVKDSIRQSDDFDVALVNLALLEKSEGLKIEQRWVAEKYLELLSFPTTFTEEEALLVILKLEQSPSVEKVVAVSAFNLEFTAGDFAREFGPTDFIPDAARRGLDASYYSLEANPAISQVIVPHVDGQFIVRWKDEYVYKADQTGFNAKMAVFNAMAGVTVLYDLYSSATELTQVLGFDPTNVSLVDELNRYNSSPWVVYAQPDYVYEGQRVPNDPIYPSQWSLPKISAPQAWDMTTGNAAPNGLIIAVADSGANINHPDFKTNLWSGTPQNFLTNPPNTNVSDDHGHGSSVASVIGAQGYNALYMSGIAWDVSLMHLKVLDNALFGRSSQIASAIEYAWQHGATAINLSLGQYYQMCDPPEPGVPPSCSPALDPAFVTALRHARGGNMVAVCAAGNNGYNTDLASKVISPANIPTNNVISVAASDQSDNRAIFSSGSSNFGKQTVDLAAPGKSIIGLKPTFNGNSSDLSNYSFFDGTSLATPHVTGAIALIKAKYPWEDYLGLRDRVLMGTDDLAPWKTLVRTGGRLNVNKSLQKRTMIRNLSTRAKVGTGNNIVIGGFIIKTDAANPNPYLKVAIRGIGPSLPLAGKLNNPKIRLNNSNGTQIAANDDWGTLPQDQKNALGTTLQPNDPREAAMVVTLRADRRSQDGRSLTGAYTVFLESHDTQLGVGLFEIYELEANANERTRLANVSTRCRVGTGDEVPIAGFILGPSIPKRSVLTFGKGPSLTALGVPGAIADPYLELHNSSGALQAANDNFGTGSNAAQPADELGEAGLHPRSTAESELWPVLASGSYTTILRGVNNSTGVGLLEVYEY